jgi:hypothetical protein
MDTNPALAEFRQELIGELGEDVACQRHGSPTGRQPLDRPVPSCGRAATLNTRR